MDLVIATYSSQDASERPAPGRRKFVILALALRACHPHGEASHDLSRRWSRMFKQQVPTIGLSIEQATSSVPDDGRFHVVIEGEIVFSSKSKSAALVHYRRLRDDLLRKSGIKHRVPDPEETKRREREFYDFEAVMSESMRQRTLKAKRKGGKGGSGGVQ